MSAFDEETRDKSRLEDSFTEFVRNQEALNESQSILNQSLGDSRIALEMLSESLTKLGSSSKPRTVGTEKILAMTPVFTPTSEKPWDFADRMALMISPLAKWEEVERVVLSHALREMPVQRRAFERDMLSSPSTPPTQLFIAVFEKAGWRVRLGANAILASPNKGETFAQFGDRVTRMYLHAGGTMGEAESMAFIETLPPAISILARVAYRGLAVKTLPNLVRELEAEIGDLVLAPAAVAGITPPSAPEFPAPSSPVRRCFYCHQTGHLIAHCPARASTCERCGRKGHKSERCKRQSSPSPDRVPPTAPPDSPINPPSAYLNSVRIGNLPVLKLGRGVEAVLDTGAQPEGVCSPEMAEQLERTFPCVRTRLASPVPISGTVDSAVALISEEIIATVPGLKEIHIGIASGFQQDLVLGVPFLEDNRVSLEFDHVDKVPTVTVGNARPTVNGTIEVTLSGIENSRANIEPDHAAEVHAGTAGDKPTENKSPEVTPISTVLPGPLVWERLPRALWDFVDVFDTQKSNELPPNRPEFDLKLDVIHEEDELPDCKMYQLSAQELAELGSYVSEMVAKGFIIPSSSPTGAGVFFVKKKDGTLRLCVDFRGINARCRKDRYPVPLIHQLIDMIIQGKPICFSKIDLKTGYNLLRMSPGSEHLTAFKTVFGLFQYRVVPFGLANAPAAFMRWMTSIFADMIGTSIVIYIDDILIFARSEEENIRITSEVLRRMRENGLVGNIKKSVFLVKLVEFLGCNISPEGISMEQGKLDEIGSWVLPATKKGMTRFIGFVGFYRKFIPGFARLIDPLYQAAAGTGSLSREEWVSRAFNRVKNAFKNNVVLKFPNFENQFIVKGDASDFALGITLSQWEGELLIPIAFHSRKLTKAEANLSPLDKELLSIVEALTVWRAWLLSAQQPFCVFTDHKNLEDFTRVRKLSR
ncbi:MAG: reverse transcriptase domain-containing protein, partial [Candidatus Paceibacterota bacterium]